MEKDVRLNAADIDVEKLDSVVLKRLVLEVQQQDVAAKIPKAEFWWACVGDGNPEPVAVTTENGRRVAYTIGCPDPIYLDEGAIALIPPCTKDPGWAHEHELPNLEPMKVPLTPEKWLAMAAQREKEWERFKGKHGHRRWNP